MEDYFNYGIPFPPFFDGAKNDCQDAEDLLAAAIADLCKLYSCISTVINYTNESAREDLYRARNRVFLSLKILDPNATTINETEEINGFSLYDAFDFALNSLIKLILLENDLAPLRCYSVISYERNKILKMR